MKKVISILLFATLIFLQLSMLSMAEDKSSELLEEAKALNRKVAELDKAGKYEQAIPYAKKSLELYEKSLGKEHPNVAIRLHWLAHLYKSTGNYAEAETLYKRVIAIDEKAYGKEHKEVATDLNSLARLYDDTGRYVEAEPLYMRVLEIREKSLGKEHPDVAASLSNLAGVYDSLTQYAKAEPLYGRAIELREKVLGKEHPDVAANLHNLAMVYYMTGRYAEAEPLYKRAIAIWEKALGKEHIYVARGLNNLAKLYSDTSRYTEAEPLYNRSLQIREKLLGHAHPDVATVLENLAVLYRETAHYAEAEPLYKRALEIREKTLGKDHPDVATSLNNLAWLYDTTGRYTEAEPLYKRALEIREQKLGKDHPDVATSLNNLAGLYDTIGRYADAEPLYKRALEIREQKLGKDHPDVATSLNNLALLYKNIGRYAEAEPLYKRVLEIDKKVYGKDHPDAATSLNNLALLYEITGRYTEAEPLLKRVLEIREQKLGKDHLNVAISLNNLAALYATTGRYSEAEPLYKRALEIREQKLGKDHPSVSTSLNNLAQLYDTTGRYAEAEPLCKRALKIREQKLGKDHPDVATNLNTLAVLYYTTGRYTEAEPLYKRALEIREQKLGKDHPDVSTSLNNLAALYEIIGRYTEAEPLYKRALEIHEKAYGKDHPDVATNLNNLAGLYEITGRHQESHTLFARSATINDKTKEMIFSLLSEKQKLAYMNQNVFYVERYISHTALNMPTDNAALTDTFNAWVLWKGSVLEAQGRYMDALMYSDDPAVRKKFQDQTEARREMAKLQFSKPEKMTPEEYQKRLSELGKRKEALDTELGNLSQEFSLASQAGKVNAQKLSSLLPKDSAYLDFAKSRLWDFQKQQWGKAHYLLFVLVPGEKGQVKLFDMGETEGIDQHINTYLKEINKIKEQKLPNKLTLDRAAQALYDLIIKPVEPLVKAKRHLFVSPDGNLNLIPFEVLSSSGEYLLEKYRISYVGAGRDVVKFAQPAFTGGTSLIMADPDYDLGLQDMEKTRKDLGLKEARVRGEVSADVRGIRFTRLPETKDEANAIDGILKTGFKQKVRNYQGPKALEEMLYASASPKVLHLATHGYFLKSSPQAERETRGMELKSDFAEIRALNSENPMLRSGIVLSGVNSSLKEGRDDGMVSAEKILGLRLKGTELVILSACETGVGDVQTGEGVFGLKRAFILSGAKTLVMSLWSVPSNETVELMKDFYTLLSQGKTKTEALRQAKLNIMKNKPNPFYWGAFVLTGSP